MPTKILVADDSATMRRVLEMTFAGEDATVHTVDGGEGALAKAAELTPDIVFADVSMPGMDGYELARRLKTHPQLGKTAVVVMTNQQTPYDENKGRAAGVDDHVSKPFDTQSVIDRVGQVLARPRAQPAGSADAGTGARPAPPPAPARAAPVPPPASAGGPPTGTTGRIPQGTRLGMGAPMQPAPAKTAAAAPQPIPTLRQGSPPLAPVPVAKNPPAPAVVAPPPAARATAPAAAPVQAATQDFGGKLAQLGLTREQVEGVLALSREVIEQVVWEVVPDLAEQLIKEEIKRLTAE